MYYTVKIFDADLEPVEIMETWSFWTAARVIFESWNSFRHETVSLTIASRKLDDRCL